MTPFGFTPENSDDAEKNNGDNSVDFAAMMHKMQQEIQEQFSKLGMSEPGFATSTEVLPKALVRDTAKKFVTAKGSAPIGANDLSKTAEAFAIAELWLNEATFSRSQLRSLTPLLRELIGSIQRLQVGRAVLSH